MQVYKSILIICCVVQFVYTQQSSTPINYDKKIIKKQSISEEDLEAYKADDDFNYKDVKSEETIFNKFIFWLKNFLRKFWESIFGSGTAAQSLDEIRKLLVGGKFVSSSICNVQYLAPQGKNGLRYAVACLFC